MRQRFKLDHLLLVEWALVIDGELDEKKKKAIIKETINNIHPALNYEKIYEEYCNGEVKHWFDRRYKTKVCSYNWISEEFTFNQKYLKGLMEMIPSLIVDLDSAEKTIDDILDKINQYGIDSLTKEDKEVLKRKNA